MFNSKFDGMPTVRHYADAEAEFNNITPRRGTDGSERPLRRRGERHKTIIKKADGSYAFKLYHTEVVTYHPDNTITIRTYDTLSTVEFMEYMLPWTVGVFLNRGKMYLSLKEIQANGWDRKFYREGREPIRLAPTETNHGVTYYHITNPETLSQDTVRVVNRARAKEIRAKLKPLMDWVHAVSALNDGDVTEIASDNPQYYGLTETIAAVVSGVATVEDYPLVLWELTKVGWSQFEVGKPERQLVPNWRDRIIDTAYKTCGVLDEVPVPIGELPKKTKWS